jgi:protein TonB
MAAPSMTAERPERLKAAAGVALLHLLIGYALVNGLAFEAAREVGETLRVFNLGEPPPPSPVEEPLPAPHRSRADEGAASPPNIRSRPTPVVAPTREVRLDVPAPVRATPEPTSVPEGADPTAGNADLPGPGSGSGGEGVGTGSGGQGTGAGSGGIASRAQRESGAIDGARDYPAAARRAGVTGSVQVRFTVGTDGRVSGCRVVRSTANEELDAATCRLIEGRFRYRPARDFEGRAIPDTISRTFDWLLPGRT